MEKIADGRTPEEPESSYPHYYVKGNYVADTYDDLGGAIYAIVRSELKKLLEGKKEDMPSLITYEFEPIKYYEIMRSLDKAIEQYKSSSEQSEEEQVHFLLDLLMTEETQRKAICDAKNLSDIHLGTLLATPQAYVKLISENYHMSFWTLWFRVRDHIVPEIATFYNDIWKPVYETERISTELYLNISSDDRLYWWRPDGDVVISDDMEVWLERAATRHRELCMEAETQPDVSLWQKSFVTLLASNNRCLFFEQPFYEFLSNFHRSEYQAAERLLEENAGDSKNYKRLETVYANYTLRKKVFGF